MHLFPVYFCYSVDQLRGGNPAMHSARLHVRWGRVASQLPASDLIAASTSSLHAFNHHNPIWMKNISYEICSLGTETNRFGTIFFPVFIVLTTFVYYSLFV